MQSAGPAGCRSRRCGRRTAQWRSGWRTPSIALTKPGPGERRRTGGILPREPAELSGSGAGRCSRSTRPETIRAPTPSGRRRSRWATGLRSARPVGTRSPPYRLITALRTAGFPADHVVLLPTDYVGADAVLRGADLGMVYGGADVMAKYRGQPGVAAGTGAVEDPHHR